MATSMLLARPISFQMVIFDSATQQPLSTADYVNVSTSFVSDSDLNEYLSATTRQRIEDGIISVRFTVDMDNQAELYVFDQPGLRLKVRLLDDVIYLPLSANTLSVLSQLSDYTVQLADNDLMHVDYNNRSIHIGGQQASTETIVVNGMLKANRFIGNGKMIYNARGGGLNDDHSLESNMSELCPK